MESIFAGIKRCDRFSAFWLLLISLPVLFGGPAQPAAAQYVYRTIDNPNAVPSNFGFAGTKANGINDSGTIVGAYSDQNPRSHGYILQGGNFTTIDFPGAIITEPTAINNSGTVVGTWTDSSGFDHGFRWVNGNFTSFDFPGSQGTQATGINSLGEIVGTFLGLDFRSHGFLLKNGAFTSFNFTGATETFPNGINDAGQIVGAYRDSSGIHGFLLSKGVFTTLTMPDGSIFRAHSINNAGQVVGAAGADVVGILLQDGTAAPIVPPGASSGFGVATGINNAAEIVGNFFAGGAEHGFLAKGPMMLDPVPDFVNGPALMSNTLLQSKGLGGRPVRGVAADGVTQVLLRIPANNIGDQFTLKLLNDQDVQSSSPVNDGALGNPGDVSFSASQLTVTAIGVDAGGGQQAPFAFAVYRAPLDFARQNADASYRSGLCSFASAGGFKVVNTSVTITPTVIFRGPPVTDDQLACRLVSIQIEDLTSGNIQSVPVVILRPPVVMIHGLWGNWTAWNNFSPLVSGPGTVDSRFSVGRVSYDAQIASSLLTTDPFYSLDARKILRENSLGFQYNAPRVHAQIGQWITKFKEGNNPAGRPVAAIQADIVAHSMGGLLTRTLGLQQTFLSDDTFRQGNIHKEIDIDTPHLGSPLAIRLLAPEENGGCLQGLLAKRGNFALSSVILSNLTLANGAILDLQGDGSGASLSEALTRLRQPGTAAHVSPTSLIVGVYQDFASLDIRALGVRLRCHSDPLAQSLTSTGWPAIFKDDFGNAPNDGIVSENSQLNGMIPSPGSQYFGYVHSKEMQGIDKLGFSPPNVLDPGAIPNQVIFLLNTPLSNTVYFNLLNP